MPLSSLAARLRNLHWTSITVELLIVVLGVFIGIEVSNWNEARVTDQQAAVFAERLRADLREEYWGYQLLVVYNQEVLKYANQAVEELTAKTPGTDEALLISAYRATQYKQRLRRRSTYDELISTGAIGLIRDQAMRDTAMRLYNVPTFENLIREGMLSRYREAFRMTVPNDVQRALARNCGDRYIRTGDFAAIHGLLDYPCRTELPPETIAEAASMLRANADLVPLLRLRIADIETRLADLTGNNRPILEGLRAIAEERR